MASPPATRWADGQFYRELVDHHYNPFLPGDVSQFARPRGSRSPWTRDLAAFPGILVQLALTACSAVAAYGLTACSGYTLTGLRCSCSCVG